MRDDLGLRHHLYLLLEEVELRDALAIAFGPFLQRKLRSKGEVLLCHVNPLYVADEKEGVDDKVSRNTGMCGDEGTGGRKKCYDSMAGLLYRSVDLGRLVEKVRNLFIVFLCMVCFDEQPLRFCKCFVLCKVCVQRWFPLVNCNYTSIFKCTLY